MAATLEIVYILLSLKLNSLSFILDHFFKINFHAHI